MKHRLKLIALIFLSLTTLITSEFFFYRAYSPTIRSFLLLNKQDTLRDRQDFIQKIFSLVPLRDGYRITNLKAYQEIAAYVEVRNCIPFPYIKAHEVGTPLWTKNSGSTVKKIRLLGRETSIPPGQKREINVNFPAVPVIYPFYCDSSNRPAGFVYAVQPTNPSPTPTPPLP